MRAAVIMLSICLAATSARSQTTTVASPHESQSKAKQLYDSGERAFRLGDFDQAIRDWRSSYDVSALPLLLYNIAQGYRAKGDAKQALFFYQQYLGADAEGE